MPCLKYKIGKVLNTKDEIFITSVFPLAVDNVFSSFHCKYGKTDMAVTVKANI